jgi:hypothetical protein
MGQELAVSVGGGGEAAGNAHAGGQLADHLAEGGVLAANLLDVAHAKFLERNDIAGHGDLPGRKRKTAFDIFRTVL